MGNRGFTLIELIVCLVIVAIVFSLGFGLIRGTRAGALTTIDKINENELINAAKTYILENNVSWISEEDNLYVCISVNDMVDNKYFKREEVSNYSNQFVKIIKNKNTQVVTDLIIMKECN